MNRLQFRRSGSAAPEVVSILSGKGGVGKSLVSFNLAFALAASGHRVLLVDADFSSGNLHILANARCEAGVRQYVSGDLGLSQAIVSLSDSIDLLGASYSGAIVDQFDITTTAHLIADLRRDGEQYDYILLDHASGISNAATVLAHGSNVCLLVLVPELTSIADAYGLYKYLIETNASLDCRLVVNRCQHVDEPGYIREKFTTLTDRFLGQAPGYLGHLEETPLVRRALALQRPLLQVDPEHHIVQQLTRLTERLTAAGSAVSEPEFSLSVTDDKKTPAAADIKE
jgi:flagellar biosynthesis protein FlhG